MAKCNIILRLTKANSLDHFRKTLKVCKLNKYFETDLHNNIDEYNNNNNL